MGTTTGEGDVSGVSRHGVGALGEYDPYLAAVVLVEGSEDCRQCLFTGWRIRVD
jgi:hypothetical protein